MGFTKGLIQMNKGHVFLGLLAVFFLAGAFAIIFSFGQDDLDEICLDNGNVLYKINNTWTCLNMSQYVTYVSLLNNANYLGFDTYIGNNFTYFNFSQTELIGQNFSILSSTSSGGLPLFLMNNGLYLYSAIGDPTFAFVNGLTLTITTLSATAEGLSISPSVYVTNDVPDGASGIKEAYKMRGRLLGQASVGERLGITFYDGVGTGISANKLAGSISSIVQAVGSNYKTGLVFDVYRGSGSTPPSAVPYTAMLINSDGIINVTNDINIAGSLVKKWLYNQTIATYDLYNSVWSSTYNSTYDGLINNASYLSTYNSTYDGLINNASYLSTYNSTYDGLINNASYLSTYNATYDATTKAWNGNASMVYNHTAIAKAYTDSKTFGDFTYYNVTKSLIATTNTTHYNQTIMTLPLSAGKDIQIECMLISNSSANTIGAGINGTITNGGSYSWLHEYYASTGALGIGTSVNVNNYALKPATSFVTQAPIRLYVHTTQVSAGVFTLYLGAEATGTTYIYQGSWCRSVEI